MRAQSRDFLSVYPALLAFFRRRLPWNRSHEAEDLIQETILAAWVALGRKEAPEILDLPPYILRIARNKFNDALRENYRRRETAPNGAKGDALVSLAVNASAEHALLEREARSRLRRAVGRLPSLQRDVLFLRFFERKGNLEVGRILRITPAEVSRLKYRALEKLRLHFRRSSKNGRFLLSVPTPVGNDLARDHGAVSVQSPGLDSSLSRKPDDNA